MSCNLIGYATRRRLVIVVAKFAGFSFILFPIKYFFNLHLLTLISPFLTDWLDDTKNIDRRHTAVLICNRFLIFIEMCIAFISFYQ